MQNPTRHILLLGSGLMAQSVASYLLRRPQNRVHIASNIVEDAKKIADNQNAIHADSCTHGPVNVTDPQSLKPLIQKAQIVISYVPAFLHVHVAKACLQLKKQMATASYVSPQMQALNDEAKQKDLIILNELGLDPGIDHLATMKIVDEVYSNGGKIVEYESWCGGLPAVAHRNDNPIGYKFTWSPIGAFRALKNKATFIKQNKEVQVQAKQLLYFGKALHLTENLTLQGYPNRNSVAYKDIYNLKDANKVLRGTLRYPGFCDVINAWKQIGLIQENPIKGQTWAQCYGLMLENQPGNNLEQKIRSRCIDKVSHYQKLSNQQKNQKYQLIIKTFKFFNLLDKQTKVHSIVNFRSLNPSITCIQNLVKHLEPFLALKEGETDLIAMQHIFVIECGQKRSCRKSSLIQQGIKNGMSAMSLTVGTPTAIGAQLILDGKIKERGVLRPIYPDIYNPVLEELQKVGIKLIEVQQKL